MKTAVAVAAFVLLSSTAFAAESKLSDPIDQVLAAKGCTYEKVMQRAGHRETQGNAHVDEGTTGRRPGDFRPWTCHNGQMYWQDTGKPWGPQK